MAHQWMRCNLASAMFPFAKDLMGRSIILPQYDQNYDRDVRANTEGVEKDKGIPQAYYMHNCVPTPQGYQAVGYDSKIAPLAGVTDFDAAFPIQDPTLARFLFSPSAGKNYIFDAVVGKWVSVSPLAPGSVRDSVVVTTAFVNGQSYIYYANLNCYKYNITTKLLDVVVLTGLTAVNTKGVCAANGYMVAWDDTTVAWSNTSVPTDFVPSVLTGAGGGAVGEAKGKIIACLPISGGFIVYCEKNAVAAKFTSNARFPYIFSEIPGSGGIQSPEQVSWQANLGEHYVWSTAGLQKFTLTGSANIFSEATDFLAALLFEDFDESTLVFTTQYLSVPLSMKVSVVGDRYVVFSYGVTFPNFTHALIFDLSSKRWGKFKITHRDCFQWNAPNLYGALTYGQLTGTYGDFGNYVTYGDLATSINNPEIPKKTIAFLQQDGTVKTVNFDLSEATANGVLMIGKFQMQRNKLITHQSTDVENVQPSGTFQMYVVPSLNGKDLLTPVPGIVQNPGLLGRRYNKRLSGLNFSDLFIGAFNLTSLLINFTMQGDR